MKKYVENMRKYVEYMKEYPLLYRLWDLEKFRASVLYRFWDLEKFREKPGGKTRKI